MDEQDTRRPAFRKSSLSGASNPQCVEVAFLENGVVVRDSKNPSGEWLMFTHAEWEAFVGGVRRGEFDGLT